MKITLPKKVKKTLYVTVKTSGGLAGDICINDYNRTSFENSDMFGTVLICTTEIEIDLPDNFDVTAPMVAALEKRRDALVQEFTLKLAQLDQELAEVRALPSPENQGE